MAARNSRPSADQIPLFAVDSYERDDRDLLCIKSRWSPKLGDTIACADCGATCPRRGQVQKYCVPCSAARDHKRKLEWAKKHPRPIEQVQAQGVRQRGRCHAVGLARHRDDRWTLSDIMVDESRFSWVRRLAIPFTLDLSKNAGQRVRQVNQEPASAARARVRASLTEAVKELVRDVPVFVGKVYLDLLVQKPTHNCDAINMIDHVSDSIRKAVGVDDRWFSYVRVDWQIIKASPEILMGIAQEVRSHHQACSYCGRILSHEMFCKNSSMAGGISRSCLECSAESSRLAYSSKKKS
jgi:hypothetical protein